MKNFIVSCINPDSADDTALWKIDGASAGAILVKDISPKGANVNEMYLESNSNKWIHKS